MTIHLFGNALSPAVAKYSLRRTIDEGEEHDPEVKELFQRQFCFDDGLVLKPRAKEIVMLIRNTQAILASVNLRLREGNESLPYVGPVERHSQLR